MGFYQAQPVSPEECSATYVYTGFGVQGVFHVVAGGNAINFSGGFQLVRDSHFVGGLKLDVMGWTGPLAEGTTPYKVKGTFDGEHRDKIYITGSNGTFAIPVKVVKFEDAEEFVKSITA